MNVTDTYIGAIERFTSKCSIETLSKIATVLNLNMDYLLYGATPDNCDTTFSDIIKTLPSDKKQLFLDLCEAIAEKLK